MCDNPNYSDIIFSDKTIIMSEPSPTRRRGSTPCPMCKHSYKNNAVPPVCQTPGCGYALGMFKQI